MLCVMVIIVDYYAYFYKVINWDSGFNQVLMLPFILCILTFCYLFIVCSVVLLVYTYYNNNKTLF
eukprot:UN09983